MCDAVIEELFGREEKYMMWYNRRNDILYCTVLVVAVIEVLLIDYKQVKLGILHMIYAVATKTVSLLNESNFDQNRWTF